MAGGILSHERETYEEMWQSVPSYSAVTVEEPTIKLFTDMTGAKSGSVLDAGCGTGKGGVILKSKGFDVMLLDFTDTGLIEDAKDLPFRNECLWDDLRPRLPKGGNVRGSYDWVFCTDVLEHIPTEYTMLVIHRLMETAKIGVFLTISLIPDNQGVWMGKALHQTVQPFVWWRDRLRSIGHVKECRDLLIKGAYYVTK